MNLTHSKFTAALAASAACALAASPALAHEHGNWGGGGWGHHDDGLDVGDVFAGLLVIGGIIAIASAASNASKNAHSGAYKAPPARSGETYGNDTRPQWQQHETGGGGIDNAVDRCTEEVARGTTRVDRVDTVSRSGEGWRVAGRATSGSQFACTVDSDGRIRSVTLDGHAL